MKPWMKASAGILLSTCLVYVACYVGMRSRRLVPASELMPSSLLRSLLLNPDRQGYHIYTDEPACHWFRPLMWLDAKLCRTPIILEDGPHDHGEVTYFGGVPVIIEKTTEFQQSVGGDSGKAAADGALTGAPQR